MILNTTSAIDCTTAKGLSDTKGVLRGTHQALRSGGISGRGQGLWQLAGDTCSVKAPSSSPAKATHAVLLWPFPPSRSTAVHHRPSFHLESVSRSHTTHRVLTGNYSWVFICWLVWLAFVSTKISPDSSPWTKISVLVSQAALVTASNGREEKSFQSHCPQTIASGDRSIAHIANCWTWGDCMPFFSKVLSHKECCYLSHSPKSRWMVWFHLAHVGHQHRQATLLWLACVSVHVCPSSCCWLASPIALHLLLRQFLLKSDTCWFIDWIWSHRDLLVFATPGLWLQVCTWEESNYRITKQDDVGNIRVLLLVSGTKHLKSWEFPEE